MQQDSSKDRKDEAGRQLNLRRPWRAAPWLYAPLCLLAATVSDSSGADDFSMESLAWLSGCWARTDLQAGSGETWTGLAGGTLYGISRSVSDGQTTFYEFMEIHRDSSGVIQYVAYPRGQTPTAFALVRADGGRYVFENPRHDFPQRIIYEPGEDGSLEGWIEGSVDGTERRIDFPMHRMECSTGN